MRILLLFLALPLWGQGLFRASHPCCDLYVDATGGSDANSGKTPAAAKQTIAAINGATLTPYQQIGFKRGETWRETLTPGRSGAAGSPITFAAYGSGARPIINGSTLVTGWTNLSGNIYYAAFGSLPARVWYDSTELTYSAGNYASLAANTFDYNTTNLYVNAGGNPTGHVVQGTHQIAVVLDVNYVIIRDLHITKSGSSNLVSTDVTTNHNTLQNVLSDYAGMQGALIGYTTGGSCPTYWTITGSTFDHNGAGTSNQWHGIYLDCLNNSTIAGNTISNSSGDGLQITNASNNNSVTQNYFLNNGATTSCSQIILYDEGAGMPTGNNITYNVANGGPRGLTFTGGSSDVVTNNIYNNTFYGFTYIGFNIDNSTHIGNLKNNIFYSAVRTYSIIHETGTGAMVSDYNIWGMDISYTLDWNGTWYDTLATYVAAVTPQDSHSISSNPTFTNAGAGDFTLQAGSPAIGAGVYIPGVSTANPPNIGAR